MRLSLATKIFLAFTAVVVIFTGVLMFGTYRTQALYGRIQQLNQTVVPISLLLSDVQTDLKSFNVVLNERDPLVLRRTLQMTRLIQFLPDRLTRTLTRAHTMASEAHLDDIGGTRRAKLATLEQRLAVVRSQAIGFAGRSRTFSQLVLDNNPAQGRQAHAEQLIDLQAQLRDDARQLDDQITSLRVDLRAATDAALASANDSQRDNLYALGALSAVALVTAAGVLLGVLMTLRRLTKLSEAAKRIGQGDYRPIESVGQSKFGGDEITMLTREFNSMADSLAAHDRKVRDQHEQLLKSERLAAIGRMTSLITHELRNPLSSINLNSEMLQEALIDRGLNAPDSDIRDLLETIIDEVDRLRDITEEYLVYARLPSPQPEAEHLDDIVESLIDFHSFEWGQAGISVDLTVRDQPIRVMADANQLRQALLNIMKNSVESTPSGGRISVEVSAPDDHAVVVITDQGPGIPDDHRSQIFEPFFTTKSNGTGLGLAMTQQIVREHHGAIDADAPPDHGAQFVIKLPVQPTEARGAELPAKDPA